MLSMKTLRVAMVTVGSALLLGSGVTVAQTAAVIIDLDQTAIPGQTADPALVYVAETLGTGASAIASGGARGNNLLNNANDFTLRVTSGAALAGNQYFLRLALGDGLVFGAALTDASCGGGSDLLVIGGNPGDSVAVCSIVTAVTKGVRGNNGLAADGTTAAGGLQVVVTDALAVSSKEPGSYTATMSLHDDQFEAEEGVDVKAAGHVGGTATVVMTTSGIAAEVKAGAPVVAEVETGFLWFVGPTAAASLGTVTVMEKNAPTATAQAPLSATDGVAVPNGNLVGDADSTASPPVPGGMSVAIEGNLGIGIWNLVQINDSEGMAIDAVADTADPDTVGVQEPPCAANFGSASSPVDIADPGANSSLALDKDDPGNMAMQSGMDPGTYKLCVTVDNAGAESNTMAIPSGEYMATAYALSGATGTRATDAIQVASGTIGTIRRNGASVSIAYITTSEKHNQRLIIVNRGSRPLTITDVTFQTEDGTEIGLIDPAGLGAIPAGESMTMPVRDMVEITGNSRRAAAVLSFNGTAANISVATTQVNLSDSSTDTVMWTVVEG